MSVNGDAEKDVDVLPAALRKLLVKVRAGLKEKGDDGSADARRTTGGASVSVKMGWPEVRAIYTLYTALGRARVSRDEWKLKAGRANNKLERTAQALKSDLQEIDLLNNRAVISLLVDVKRCLQGDPDVTEMQVHETLKRVDALIRRAKKRR